MLFFRIYKWRGSRRGFKVFGIFFILCLVRTEFLPLSAILLFFTANLNEIRPSFFKAYCLCHFFSQDYLVVCKAGLYKNKALCLLLNF